MVAVRLNEEPLERSSGLSGWSGGASMAAAVVTAVTAVMAVVAVVGAEPFGSAAPHLLTASVSCVSLSFWMLSSSMAVNARESAMVLESSQAPAVT